MDLDSIAMKPGTHVTELTGTDVVTRGQLSYIVVWADRPYDHCPRCGQPVNQEPGCPVNLDEGAMQGGQLEPWDQMHGCGEWLSVSWAEVTSTGEVTEDVILAVSQELWRGLEQEREEQRKVMSAQLRTELKAALARLAEPLDEDETAQEREEEVRTGSDMDPGIYREEGGWIAWGYDPDGSGDIVEVTEDDVDADVE